MKHLIRLDYAIAGIIALSAALLLFFFMNGLKGIFASPKLFSEVSPVGIFVIFGIMVFGSIYLLGTAGSIFRETVR